MFISPPILEEIEGVLTRKFGWTVSRAHEATRTVRGFAVLVHPSEPVNAVREDAPDNRILECAIAARADAIVTGDRHLLRLKRFGNTAIVNPRGFLDGR